MNMESRKNSVLSYPSLVKKLHGDSLVKGNSDRQKIRSVISSDLVSDILMYLEQDALLLTGLVNPQIVQVADMIDIGGVIFVQGKRPEQSIIDKARDKNVPLATTNYTLFEASGKLYQAGLKSCPYSEE